MKAKGILFLLGGLALGLLLGALVFFGGPSAARSSGNRVLPPTVGSPVEEFALTDLSGDSVKLSDLRGTPVVINYWATWCIPCKEEMPLLEEYAEKYSDRLVVLGINVQEGQEPVQQYVSNLGISFPVLLDNDGAVSRKYYVRSYPATFFVDEEGVLRAQHLGQLNADLLDTYLETVGIRE